MRFSIAKLLIATAVVAVFLGLRNGYVFGSSAQLPTIGERACWTIGIMAVMVSAFACAQTPLDTRRRVIVTQAALAGGLAAGLSAAIFSLEMFVIVDAAFHDYAPWRMDNLIFAILGFGAGFSSGSVIGAIVGSIWGVSSPRRRNAAKVNESR